MLLNLDVPNQVKIWKYSKNVELKVNSINELNWKGKLSEKSFYSYCQSRGYIRHSLSKIFEVSPLEIPLQSNPGEAPKLSPKWGYVSLSHSKDHFIIAWAPNPVGIDLEIKKRVFPADKLFNRILSKYEQKSIKPNNKNEFREIVLQYWVIKEAAFKWQKDKESSDLFNWEWIKESYYAINDRRSLKVQTFLLPYESFFIGLAYNNFDNYS